MFAVISWIVVELLLVQNFGWILIQNYKLLRAILGVVIIVFGVLMMSEQLKTRLGLGSLSLKSTPTAPKSLASVYLVGLGYTIMAAPCAAPAIVAVFLLFGTQSTIWGILLLYIVVSIGIAIPYLAIALVTGEARYKMATTISKSARRIELVVGLILIIIGIILILPYFGFPVLL
jgi:cytochrome c-type biogenesis protein